MIRQIKISPNWVDRVSPREYDILLEASFMPVGMWSDEFRKRVEPIIDRLIAEDREMSTKLWISPTEVA